METVGLSIDPATPVPDVSGEGAELVRRRVLWSEAPRPSDLAAAGGRVTQAATHFQRAHSIALDDLGSEIVEGHQIPVVERHLSWCQRIFEIHETRGEKDDAPKLRRQRLEVRLDLASDRFSSCDRFGMISDLRTTLRDRVYLREADLDDTFAAAMVDVVCDAICVTTISRSAADLCEVRCPGKCSCL